MVDDLSGFWVHLIPVAVLATVVLLNRRLIFRWTDRRFHREAARLRTALAAELAALEVLYEDNLRLVSERANHVFSGRALLAVYRANLGRLTMLSPEEITALVTAHAHQGRLEALLAVHCKPHSNLAWHTPSEDAPLEQIKQAILLAAAATEHAASVLDAKTGGIANVPIDGREAPARQQDAELADAYRLAPDYRQSAA